MYRLAGQGAPRFGWTRLVSNGRRGYAGTELLVTVGLVALVLGGTAMLADPLAFDGDPLPPATPHATVGGPFESQPLYALAISADSQRVAVGGVGGRVRMWDADSGQTLADLRIGPAHVKSLAFANKGARLFAADSAGTLTVIDRIGSQTTTKSISAANCEILDIAVSRDEQRLALGGGDGSIVVRNAGTLAVERVWRGHVNAVRSVRFSPNGLRLASCSDDGSIRIWNRTTGLEVGRHVAQHGSPIQSVAYSPDGSQLVSGGQDGIVRLWRGDSLELVREFPGEGSAVLSVGFDPTGRRVAAGSMDHAVYVWSTERSTDFEVLTGHRNCVRRIAFCSTEGRLCTASWDGTARLWDLETGAQPTQFAAK